MTPEPYGPELIDYAVGALGNPNPPDLGTSEAQGQGFYTITTTAIGGSGHGIHVGTIDEFLEFGETYRVQVEVTAFDAIGEITVFRANSQFSGLQSTLGNITGVGTYTYETTVDDGNNCITLRMDDRDSGEDVTVGDTATVRVSIKKAIPAFVGTSGIALSSDAAMRAEVEFTGVSGIEALAEGALSAELHFNGGASVDFGSNAALAGFVHFNGQAGTQFATETLLASIVVFGGSTGRAFATEAILAPRIHFGGEAGMTYGASALLDALRSLIATPRGVSFAAKGRVNRSAPIPFAASGRIDLGAASIPELVVFIDVFSATAPAVTFHTSLPTLWLTDGSVPPSSRQIFVGFEEREIIVAADDRELIL